jgi:hypothetical protein
MGVECSHSEERVKALRLGRKRVLFEEVNRVFVVGATGGVNVMIA